MKYIALFLIGLIVLNCAAAAQPLTVKAGPLATSEVWSGEISVEGDVTVPKGTELTILPGTKFLYDREPRLIVYGTLKVGRAALGEGKYDLIPLDPQTRIINVTPYEVDTKILRDEFRVFRTQYVILWTVLTAGLIYAVANR